MREIKRRVQRPKLRLMRSADGRLMPASQDDIGDIWAEQKRIQLREAILDDKRRAEKRQKRRQILARTKKRLLKSSVGRSQTKRRSSPVAGGDVKEIEIRFNFPKFALPKIPRMRKSSLGLRKIFGKKPTLFALLAVLLALVAAGTWFIFGGQQQQTANNSNGQSNILGGKSGKTEVPQFATLLPEGKTAADLGGWGRVSPPDRDPVFAYADNISGVKVTVSEQPLPESLKDDLTSQIANLAGQFNANQKISAENAEAYLGTSVNGPQSLVASKGGLLLLIKSASNIPNEQWAAYINSLQ